MDRRTILRADMTKLLGAFRDFANIPEKDKSESVIKTLIWT